MQAGAKPPDGPTRVNARTRAAILLGFAALAVFGAAEIASRFIERADRRPASPRPATQAAAPGFSESAGEVDPPREQDRRLLAQHAQAIERALLSDDPRRRATALDMLLPDLLRAEPAMVVDMLARQRSGEARSALRDEMARRWVMLDRESALLWLETLDENERAAAGALAVAALAARSPGQALAAADRLGVGRHDGSRERIVQAWAVEDPDAAQRWRQGQRR